MPRRKPDPMDADDDCPGICAICGHEALVVNFSNTSEAIDLCGPCRTAVLEAPTWPDWRWTIQQMRACFSAQHVVQS